MRKKIRWKSDEQTCFWREKRLDSRGRMRFRNMASELYERSLSEYQEKNFCNFWKKDRLTIRCDELWLFILKKKNRQWICFALYVCTREITSVYLENAIHRQCAVSYTDFWSSYAEIFPSGRYRAVAFGQVWSTQTTLRQRSKRFPCRFSVNIQKVSWSCTTSFLTTGVAFVLILLSFSLT